MGVERIGQAFARARCEDRAAFIAYLTAGYPSLAVTERLITALADAGVDLLELGIPFSDPLADGPTIQGASAQALAHGTTVRGILQMVRRVRPRTAMPLIAMTYANPVYRYGVGAFCREAATVGFDGLIVPDLPPEEAGELLQAARPQRLATIFLAAPTSPTARLRRIVACSTGFIYYVSLTGVTGARRHLPPEVTAHVRALKRMTRTPVAVGFGVSRPSQVRRLAGVADGVIVGSALVEAVTRARGRPHLAARVARAVRPLVEATQR